MDLQRRAELHAALGDPARLAIVDELTVSDRSPRELSALLGVSPSLLAFHLDTLARAGLLERLRSAGDGRRKYVRLRTDRLGPISGGPPSPPDRVLFVCTRNSARSQLAAALWSAAGGPGRPGTVSSAGTRPADRVHPGACAAARRAGLDLDRAVPRRLGPIRAEERVITVCDRAHEDLPVGVPHWHWSIPDPVDDGTDRAFDDAIRRLRERMATFATPDPPPADPYTEAT